LSASGKAARIWVEGRVQGVGFRWWLTQQAQALGLRGWVRNRREGSVEAFAVGDAEALERLIALCQNGPPGAEVRAVRDEPAEDDGSAAFEQRSTV
jgi:acylphosphatase